MGYNLYITRASSSLETAEHPIPEAEWKTIVESDPSLKVSPEDYFERRTDDSGIERIYLVIWQEHPDGVPFWLDDGAIKTKNPDDKTVEKMVQLAGSLGARVLGEEDEEYLAGGKTVTKQVDKTVLLQRQRHSPVVVKALAILAIVALLPEIFSGPPAAGQNALSKVLLAANMLSIVCAWLGLILATLIGFASVIPRKAKMIMWVWAVLSLIAVVILNPLLRL
jgi:hypothetical protein